MRAALLIASVALVVGIAAFLRSGAGPDPAVTEAAVRTLTEQVQQLGGRVRQVEAQAAALRIKADESAAATLAAAGAVGAGAAGGTATATAAAPGDANPAAPPTANGYGVVFEDELPIVGDFLAQALFLKDDQRPRMQATIRRAFGRFLALERGHTEFVDRDDDHVSVQVSPLGQEGVNLERDLWVDLAGVLDERQVELAKRLAGLDEIFGGFGVSTRKIDITRTDTGFAVLDQREGLTGSTAGPELPGAVARFWSRP